MLENAADIGFIQKKLEYSQIFTTDIDTHVAIHTVQDVHRLTHPVHVDIERQQPSEEDRLHASCLSRRKGEDND